MNKRLIIAIDGPAASGKSTTAQRLAQKLGYVYLDTGAMYRACALKARQEGIDLQDESAIQSMLDIIDIRIVLSDHANVIMLDGKDVSQAIRENAISKMASDISALPAVRHKMVELQRKLAADGGVILDGRDIGTFVFPDADIKFFLTASAEVRAQRRLLELQEKGISASIDNVLQEILERDRNDANRALAPLLRADDAMEVDTSKLSIDDEVSRLYDLIQARMATE